jgi:hypothetical protein
MRKQSLQGKIVDEEHPLDLNRYSPEEDFLGISISSDLSEAEMKLKYLHGAKGT